MPLLSQELLLPIIPTDLSFFQDSFFDQTRRYFEMAVKEIIDRCGLSSTDHLSSYRRLRQKDLRTENRAVSVTDQQNERKITVDVKDFKDGDLKVKTIGHDVTVEGQVRVKKGASTSNHTFRRRFTLPDVVDMASVTATVSTDGILTVTAPKKNLVQQQSTGLDILNDISNVSQQKSTSFGISPSSFGSCPLSNNISEHKSTVETREESRINEQKNHHRINTDSPSSLNTMHQKNFEKDRYHGRDIKIRQMTPLPIMIRGSFFEDSFFRPAQRDFEVALNRILRKFDIDYSSDDFFNKYRILRDKHFTDETQAVNLSEDNSNHKIVLDVQDFKDGNVQVKAVGQNLVVEGRTEKPRNGSKSTHTFRRQFSMPHNAKLTDVTAALSSDGILTILAKKDSKSRDCNEIFIPIEVTGRYDKKKNQESVTNMKTDQLTRDISIDNWQQTKSASQKTEKSKNEHIIPIELEGTDINHLHEHQLLKQQQQQLLMKQQEKLLQQEKQIQEQLRTLSEQEEWIRQQQKNIDKQKQNYRRLQRRARVEQMVPQTRSKSQSPPMPDDFPGTDNVFKSPVQEDCLDFPVTESLVKSPVKDGVDKSPVMEETVMSPTAQELHHSKVPVVKNIHISSALPHTWQPKAAQSQQSSVQQDTRQSLSTHKSDHSRISLGSYQTSAVNKPPSLAHQHTWQPPPVTQDTSWSSVTQDTNRSLATNGVCLSPNELEECLSGKTSPPETAYGKSSEHTSEPQYFSNRFNRQRRFDEDSMNHIISSQATDKQVINDQESYQQTSKEQGSNLLQFKENEIIENRHNNTRSSRFLPIRTDSTVSSMSSATEDLTNDAEVETSNRFNRQRHFDEYSTNHSISSQDTDNQGIIDKESYQQTSQEQGSNLLQFKENEIIENQHNNTRSSRFLPIRTDSTVSSMSSATEDLTNDAEAGISNRFNRQRHFDEYSMNHSISSQDTDKQGLSDKESYQQTSQEQGSNLLHFKENEMIKDQHDSTRSSRFLPIRTDSTVSSMSSATEDLTNDAEVETIRNLHSSDRSRVLPIRMDSTLSSVSSISEDLTNDAEIANILQKSSNTSKANKTSFSENDLLKNNFSLYNPLTMSMKDSSFPIERRGSFFQDSFFDNHQGLFQSAVSKVLDDFGIDSSFDDLTAYRTLRQSISSEASQAAQISEEEKEYKIVLDVHDFVGGEVRIRAEGQTLVVEGRIQKNKGNSTSSQSIRRSFSFPTSVDMEAVTSALSSDGVLTVTAPKSDHFSIVEVDDSGEVKEGSKPSTQTMQGSTTCTRSSRSSTKKAGGWKEQSSFHETSFDDGIAKETSTKTFQSSSTTESLI